MTEKKPQVQKESKCGKTLIFCAYIVKNGKRIYPRRAKAFCIAV